MFIGRFVKDEDDVLIYGRAIGMKHVPERDDATANDIEDRPWKEKWPHYVRVHHAEFIAGELSNGVSLNELMSVLQSDSFSSTQRNAAKGDGNTKPRRAYQQQAAVQLSSEGLDWLNERLECAYAKHGKLSRSDLATLDRPELPPA